MPVDPLPLPEPHHVRECPGSGNCDGGCVTAACVHARVKIVVNVGGVIVPQYFLSDGPPPGFVLHPYSGPGPEGGHVEEAIPLAAEHGAWLTELVDHGASLAWASSRRAIASEWIAPRLGLPAGLPALDVDGVSGVRFGRSYIFGAVAAYAEQMPLVWIDDLFGGKDHLWAEDRTRDDGIPTLLVPVAPRDGLRRQHIEEVLAWLDRSAGIRS